MDNDPEREGNPIYRDLGKDFTAKCGHFFIETGFGLKFTSIKSIQPVKLVNFKSKIKRTYILK